MRRWQVVLLWLIAVVAITFAMISLDLPSGLINAVVLGLAFGALAHLSQSQYWHYLKNKNFNPFSKNFGKSSVDRPIDPPRTIRKQRLDTPAKRLWFLTMIAGLLICCVAIGVFAWQHPHRSLLKIFDYRNRYGGYKFALLLGISAAIFGLIFSYLHDKLIGRLVQWVRGTGSAP